MLPASPFELGGSSAGGGTFDWGFSPFSRKECSVFDCAEVEGSFPVTVNPPQQPEEVPKKRHTVSRPNGAQAAEKFEEAAEDLQCEI